MEIFWFKLWLQFHSWDVNQLQFPYAQNKYNMQRGKSEVYKNLSHNVRLYSGYMSFCDQFSAKPNLFDYVRGNIAPRCARVPESMCLVMCRSHRFLLRLFLVVAESKVPRTRQVSESPSLWSQVLMQTLWLLRRESGDGETNSGSRAAQTRDKVSLHQPCMRWSQCRTRRALGTTLLNYKM